MQAIAREKYHHEDHEGHEVELDYKGYPTACRGHSTDGGSLLESQSITPQGGEAAALPFGRPRGTKPRGRYNLIVKFFVIFVYFVVNEYYYMSLVPMV